MRNYFDLFLEGRVEALKRLGYKGKRNLLMERKDEIIGMLEANPPTTYKEAQARIKEATGLLRSLPQVCEFLKKPDYAP
jgi:transposase